MYGFNVTDQTFSYDNRPQVPLYDMTFEQWWLVSDVRFLPVLRALTAHLSTVTLTTLPTTATSLSSLLAEPSTPSSLATRVPRLGTPPRRGKSAFRVPTARA